MSPSLTAAAAIAALLSAALAAPDSDAFIGIADSSGTIAPLAAWTEGRWLPSDRIPPRPEMLAVDDEHTIAWTGVSRPERFIAISDIDRRAVLESSQADLRRAEDRAVRDFNLRNAAQGLRFPAGDAERHRASLEFEIGVRCGAPDGFTYTYVEWIKRYASPAITRLRATVRERQGLRVAQVEVEADMEEFDRGPMRPLAAFRHAGKIYWLVHRQRECSVGIYDLAVVENGIPRELRLRVP